MCSFPRFTSTININYDDETTGTYCYISCIVIVVKKHGYKYVYALQPSVVTFCNIDRNIPDDDVMNTYERPTYLFSGGTATFPKVNNDIRDNLLKSYDDDVCIQVCCNQILASRYACVSAARAAAMCAHARVHASTFEPHACVCVL